MRTITGTAVTPYGMCGFGYVDDCCRCDINVLADFVPIWA